MMNWQRDAMAAPGGPTCATDPLQRPLQLATHHDQQLPMTLSLSQHKHTSTANIDGTWCTALDT